MTPFDTFFASHFGPALKDAPPDAKKAARESAVQIWNAALESIAKEDWHVDFVVANGSTPDIIGQCLKAVSDSVRVAIRAKITS